MRAVPCGDPARAVGLRTAHHDSVQGGLALAVVALSALAAARPPARRFTGAVVGVAAAYLGLVCLARPDVVGGVGPAWSWLSTAWGLAFAVAAALAPGEVRPAEPEPTLSPNVR